MEKLYSEKKEKKKEKGSSCVVHGSCWHGQPDEGYPEVGILGSYVIGLGSILGFLWLVPRHTKNWEAVSDQVLPILCSFRGCDLVSWAVYYRDYRSKFNCHIWSVVCIFS